MGHMTDGLVVKYVVERIIRFDGQGSLKAYCDLTVDGAITIKGLRVVEGKNGLFVTMPRHQGKDAKWYDVVVAATKEVREEIARVVLAEYGKELVGS